jgi:dTMP kinase
MPTKGTLIVIDAIDGAGKGTVMDALEAHLRMTGRDYLRVAEPTHDGIGKVIRDELIATHDDGRTYSGRSAAMAFALDREVLYKKIVLPFLAETPNRVVIQDRGVISSLAYQPLQDASVTLDWLLSLEGNRVELSRSPDLFLVLRLDPAEAERRLAGRTEKRDNSVYERTDFQERLAARYRDPDVLKPYRDAGTLIVEIDASQSKEDVAQACLNALQPILDRSA